MSQIIEKSPLKNKKLTLVSTKMLWAYVFGATIAILLLSSQFTRVSTELRQMQAVTFKGQMQEGKACGLLTTQEAGSLLQVSHVATSGTIIADNSPTAASREGSPRVDSCSHVGAESNGAYIDIVIRQYDSLQRAEDAYKKDIAKVIGGNYPQYEIVKDTKVYYAAGVHYVLKHNTVLEVSAAKNGAAFGEAQQQFSLEISKHIAAKLW